MTYERRGVKVIQELINQTPTLEEPMLTSLIIGPCNQVVTENEVLSSIPYSEEDLDISNMTAEDGHADAKLFDGLPTYTTGKHYVDAVYYDTAAEAYFPAKEVTAGIALPISASISANGTAITVAGDYSSYGSGSKLIIYNGTTIEYLPISAAVYSSPDTTFTVTGIEYSYDASNAIVMLIDSSDAAGSSEDFFTEVIPVNTDTRTSSAIAFVYQSTDDLTSLKIVVTTYPLTISYPLLKSGAVVDQDTVGFTIKDAKAVVADGFLSDIGESDNTFAAIDATNKIVTLTTDFQSGTTADKYVGMYIELSNATYTERRIITANAAVNGNKTVTVSEAFTGTYTNVDSAKVFILQEIGDSVINTFGQFDFDSLGVEPGDVIEYSSNGGSYIISSVDADDHSKLNLATSIYRAVRSDDSSTSKFVIYRMYSELDLSTDVSTKDWITQSDSVIMYSIEDNDNNRIIDGELYMSYVAFRNDLSNQILQYNDITELRAAMDIHLSNPLGYALMIALANNDSTPAYGLAVLTDDQTGYSEAFELTEGRDDIYCLVPLSDSNTITGLAKTNVEEQSDVTNSNFRITLITTPLQDTSDIAEGSGTIL